MGMSYSNGEWSWNNAGSLTNESFENWAEGHPHAGMKIAFMVFSDGAQWQSSTFYPGVPICEKNQDKTVPTTQPAKSTNILDKGCSPPWVQIYDGCYQIPKAEFAGFWDHGEKFCHEQGGYLVEINTREEQDRLTGDCL